MNTSPKSSQKPRRGLIALSLCVLAICLWVNLGTNGFLADLRLPREGLTSDSAESRLVLTSKPILTENKLLRLSYEASDEHGITEIALRVFPDDPLPGANNAPVDIQLPAPVSKRLLRTDFQDLSYYPWAGQTVTAQIVVTNGKGKKTLSDRVELTLPERRFLNPVAQALVAERKKLMQNPDSDALREEAANIMAGFAQQTASYYGDQVVFMALRSGAVRLVLGHDKDAAISVNNLLWQIATRLEEGNPKAVQRSARNSNGS